MLRKDLRKDKDISEFKGECLIIGGGWDERSQKNQKEGPIWRTNSDFFTIDMDKKRMPDLLANILTLRIDHKKKFKFILFENFFLNEGTKGNVTEQDYIQMFETAQKLLTDDGLLVYEGGYNTKHFVPKSFSDLFISAGFQFFEEIPNIFTALSPNDTRRTTTVCASINVKINLKEKSSHVHLPQAAQNCIVNFVWRALGYAPKTEAKDSPPNKPNVMEPSISLSSSPPQGSGNNQRLDDALLKKQSRAAKTMQSFFRRKITTNNYLQKIKTKIHTSTDAGKFEEVASLAKLATQIQRNITPKIR